MVSRHCFMCGSTLNCQTLCLGARPRYNLVVEEDVKKPTNQPLASEILTVNTLTIVRRLLYLLDRMSHLSLLACGLKREHPNKTRQKVRERRRLSRVNQLSRACQNKGKIKKVRSRFVCVAVFNPETCKDQRSLET